jgi:hypothetical protein
METALLIKHYPIFVIVLSATLVGVSLTLGNAWAQQRGLVIPEPSDVAPPANATSPGTIMKNNINATSPVIVSNNTIEVPSNITNATLEPESPQSNNTTNKSKTVDLPP